MARGGSRKGAGRKPGSATVRTREIAERLSQTGASPLEVMLDAMRYFHDRAISELRECGSAGSKTVAEAFASAATIAKDAAPFLHPKLSSIEHSGPDGGDIPFTFVLDRAEDR